MHALEAAGERFAPLEMASLVHQESSILAVRLRDEAMDSGTNIVVDSVLSHRSSALDLGERLHAGGYDVTVIDVETTYEISASRVEQRWREVTRAYLGDETRTGLGGRWVPSEDTRGLFLNDLEGRSGSEAVACEGVVLASEPFAVRPRDLVLPQVLGVRPVPPGRVWGGCPVFS